MPPITPITAATLTLLGLVACRSATDITRSDDEVEAWVAEQKARERHKEHASPGSSLPPPPADDSSPRPAAPPATPAPATTATGPCSAAWYEHVEHSLHVADSEGHGPDLGSAEWKATVERRLGVDADPAFPEPGTAAWCSRVDILVAERSPPPR
ncbi:MAG: hypothetical protein OEZ06_06720 [Myxococcales bacterium]|nr:hypothetical protein [Myxococcales bacterium]